MPQINAIKSWRTCLPDAEIILFGDIGGGSEIAEQLGLLYIPDIRSSSQNTPYINEMFIRASEIAAHDICCFLNADIIILQKFVDSLIKIYSLLKKRYLVVGQRLDIDLDFAIDFASAAWEARLLSIVSKEGTIHPPAGSDFFVFPKGQYRGGDICDLLVGRAGWDLWMIYNARLRKLRTVDLSPTVMVIHQNHDYSHRKVKFVSPRYDDEALANYLHVPESERYVYNLSACNFSYKDSQIQRNFARGDFKRYITHELNLRKSNMFAKFLKRSLRKVGLTY